MRLTAVRELLAGSRLRGPGQLTIVPVHAALRLRLDLPGRIAIRCGIYTPFGASVRGERREWCPIPIAARGPIGVLVALLVGGVPGARRGRTRARDQGGLGMNEAAGKRDQQSGDDSLEQRLLAAVGRVSGANTIAGALAAAARPEAAVGAAVSAGAYTAVPLVETMFAGGYGMGLGGGNAAPAGETTTGPSMGGGGGGGGGGAGRSRVVAVLVVGPDGVELRPVVDFTKLGLAGLAAALGVAGIVRRWWR